MEKLRILESVLGKSQKANRDYYQFTCPFCGHHKPKLGISLNSGVWKCWVCQTKGSSVQSLFKKLNQPEAVISKLSEHFQDHKKIEYTKVESLQLPKEFIPLYQPSTGSLFFNNAKKYLLSRGLTELDFIKHKIGYCERGQYDDMVIFPTFDEIGKLSLFTARSFTNLHVQKFQIPKSVDKNNVIPDEHLINWSEPVIVVESKINAITIRRNVVYLEGKQLLNKFKQKVLESATPAVILCLDGDALNELMSNAEYFIENGIDVFKVELNGNEDANSLGYAEIWKRINNATKLTETDIWKFKMLNKLKK